MSASDGTLDKIIRLTGAEDSSGLRTALTNALTVKESVMGRFNVSCFLENSDKSVEFFGFTEPELMSLFDTKAKGEVFVNKDIRGHYLAVDTSKVSHISAIPSY